MQLADISYILLFVLGTAFGSFLNVVIFRFDPDSHLLKDVYGRSRCRHCKKVLRWYELVPLLSFVLQLGRCRKCRARLSLQYPTVELLSGLAFVLVPFSLVPIGVQAMVPYFQIVIWILAALALLLISVIDLRLRIIPDELNIFLGVLAVVNAFSIAFAGGFGQVKDGLYNGFFGPHTEVGGSFLGIQGTMLWITQNPWLNFLAGALFAALLFGSIYFLSRGRAMGFGDVKMAIPAGFLLGFPDMVVATIIAFITGALSGVFLILIKKKKGIKDTLPFGPFIAFGIITTFFLGYDIVNAYFNFFNWIY